MSETKFTPGPGMHISAACERAAELAREHNEDVTFTFNDTEVTAHPGDLAADLESRWRTAMDTAAEAYRNSDGYPELSVLND